MGQNGNWKIEGYKIKQIESADNILDGNDWIILMISPDNERAGELRVYMDRKAKNIKASNIYVKEDHRRKGIAGALYDFAEEILDKKMRPAYEFSDDEDDFSSDADSFWKNRR